MKIGKGRQILRGSEIVAEQELAELCGSVEHVVYHNDQNQYTVLALVSENERATVVGTFPYVSQIGRAHV